MTCMKCRVYILIKLHQVLNYFFPGAKSKTIKKLRLILGDSQDQNKSSVSRALTDWLDDCNLKGHSLRVKINHK